jgi:hypothetical protein
MTRRQLLRRSGKLCCHVLRNLALYRSGWRGGLLRVDGVFWRSANSNFLDIAFLEWAKLFADWNGRYHWRKVISDPEAFHAGLFQKLRMNETDFADYLVQVKTYRDKFLAHLDELDVMNIPHTNVARKSAAYLFDYLRSNEEIEGCFHDAPATAADFYKIIAIQGSQTYSKAEQLFA